MIPTLYAITKDMQAFDDLLTEVGGDVTEEQAQAAIDSWLTENKANLTVKADGYLCMIKGIEARAEARTVEAKRLAALAKIDDNAVDRLKERLLWALQQVGIKKMETEHFKLTVATNGGKPPLHIAAATEPEHVPDKYARTIYRKEFDKDAIRADLDAGVDLPWAKIMPPGQSLRIK